MRTVARSRLLYRSRVEQASWGINHYFGCQNGCSYCSQMRRALRFKQCRSRREWMRPKPVKNAIPQLISELGSLPQLRLLDQFVTLCWATDPYQEIENELHLTSEILKELVGRNIRVKILTKNESVTHDEDTIIRHRNLVSVGMTITTLDDELARIEEPYASAVHDRVKTLRYFHANGVPTFCFVEPTLDGKPLLIVEKLVDDVDQWYFGKDNYTRRAFPYPAIRDGIVTWFRERGMTNYLIKKELWGV